MTTLTDIYNYLPLTGNLLTSGQPTREQFDTIAKAGVQTVINLALETSTNALQDEAGVVRDLGMEYVHIPVIWEQPTRDALIKFMDTMDGQGEKKVLVHCAANMRVSVFVALYRSLRLGWDREAAFKDVHQIWDPSEEKVWREFIEAALEK
jgi:uncharacterized protein (TIGR01244 family)